MVSPPGVGRVKLRLMKTKRAPVRGSTVIPNDRLCRFRLRTWLGGAGLSQTAKPVPSSIIQLPLTYYTAVADVLRNYR